MRGLKMLYIRVGTTLMRRFVCKLCAILALSLLPTTATAQGIVGLSPEAPPIYSMRNSGIDLATSDVRIENEDISVGSGEFPTKLTLKRTYSAIGYPLRNLPSIATQNQYTGFGQGSTHNLLAYFTTQKCSGAKNSRIISLSAAVFGRPYLFSGGGCIARGPSILVNAQDDGATMRIVDPDQPVWTYELTTPEGVRVLFTDALGYQYDTIGGRYATSAEFPNGDFIGFTYGASPTVPGTVRLATIYNSRGYGLRLTYKRRVRYFGGNTLTDSSLISSVTSFKNNAARTLDLSTVFYAYDPAEFLVSSIQNAAGGLYRYTYNEGRPTGIFLPNNFTSTPSTALSYLDGISQVGPWGISANAPGTFYLVSGGIRDNVEDVSWSVPNSVTDAMGNITLFKFSDPTNINPLKLEVSKPDGTSKFYARIPCPSSPFCPPLPPNFMKMPTHYVDENKQSWYYTYDGHGRPLSTTGPEGGVKSVVRDARGNITEVRNQPVPGSGLSAISSSTGFIDCTSDNFKFCNRPTFTIDPRGGRWDFAYDPISGGLAVSLAPADSNGQRAATRYNYAQLPYGSAGLPSQLTATGVFLPISKDICLISESLSGTVDFNFVCPTEGRVRETYTYGSSTLELSGVTPDADSNQASQSYGFDDVGNTTSSTDLMGNTSFITYDSLRRKVFEIGVDPDRAGPLTRPIVRHVYDNNGNEIRTETGNGNQTDGSDFMITQFVRRTFDLNDQPVRVEEVTP